MNSVEEFMEYYGLIEIPDDDDVITESLSATFGKISRSLSDMDHIKKTWNSIISRFTRKSIEKIVPKKEARKLIDLYKDMITDSKYSSYKSKFDKLCKAFGIPNSETIIESFQVGNVEGDPENMKMILKYSHGRKRVIIPNGLCLIHNAESSNLTELKPAFKTKKNSKIMFPTQRCYFKLGKETKPSNNNNEKDSRKYTTKETFQTAYIDPVSANFNNSAVYIDTNQPIKMVKFSDKMKKIFGFTKESASEQELDAKLFIYEQEMVGKITAEERDTLLERVNEVSDIISLMNEEGDGKCE